MDDFRDAARFALAPAHEILKQKRKGVRFANAKRKKSSASQPPLPRPGRELLEALGGKNCVLLNRALLRECRTALRLSRRNLAPLLGMTYEALCRAETGRRRICLTLPERKLLYREIILLVEVQAARRED